MNKGTITIARSHGGNHDGQPVHIEIRDELSFTRFVEVRISLEAFAAALFGLSEQECSFELRAQNVGKRYEHKTELVPRPGWEHRVNREEHAKAFLAPYEVDGWKGRVDDLYNHHNRVGDKQKVSFTRYVPVEAPETQMT